MPGESTVIRYGGRRDQWYPFAAIAAPLAAAADADILLAAVMEAVTRTLRAERSTLFLIDAGRQELWSKIAQQLEIAEIRMPVGQGIAGQVAATGETLNITD